jgi:Rrf2 family protein
MKLITRETDYAIRALLFMAGCKKGEVVSVGELVKALGIPRPFLRKILQVLTRRRFLESRRGKGGGFRLVRPAEAISLACLVEAFQGPMVLSECSFKKKLCPNVRVCGLKTRIDKMQRYVLGEMKDISLRSLLK